MNSHESRACFSMPSRQVPTSTTMPGCYRAGSRRGEIVQQRGSDVQAGEFAGAGRRRRQGRPNGDSGGAPGGGGAPSAVRHSERPSRARSAMRSRASHSDREHRGHAEGIEGDAFGRRARGSRTGRRRSGPARSSCARVPKRSSDTELVALFVRSGTKGRTAVDLARGAIVAAGGLRELLDLPREDLFRLPGFGPARYVELQACLEIGRRHLGTRLERGEPLASTAETARFLMARLRHLPFEVFSCLFLDNRHRVIEFEELFRGTIDGTSVHAREVVRRALNHNAAAVIFAHNHPSGVAEPSQADRVLTDQLVSALSMVEVTVVDHLVVGDGDCVSFVDLGLL